MPILQNYPTVSEPTGKDTSIGERKEKASRDVGAPRFEKSKFRLYAKVIIVILLVSNLLKRGA